MVSLRNFVPTILSMFWLKCQGKCQETFVSGKMWGGYKVGVEERAVDQESL